MPGDSPSWLPSEVINVVSAALKAARIATQPRRQLCPLQGSTGLDRVPGGPAVFLSFSTVLPAPPWLCELGQLQLPCIHSQL
jgi:hypothetical protein